METCTWCIGRSGHAPELHPCVMMRALPPSWGGSGCKTTSKYILCDRNCRLHCFQWPHNTSSWLPQTTAGLLSQTSDDNIVLHWQHCNLSPIIEKISQTQPCFYCNLGLKSCGQLNWRTWNTFRNFHKTLLTGRITKNSKMHHRLLTVAKWMI